MSREGLAVCLGCNLITGVAVLAWFALSGMTSLLSATHIKKPSEIAGACCANVYYVNPQTHDLWCVGSNGFNPHSTGLAVPNGETASVRQATNGDAKVYLVREDGSVDKPLLNLGPQALSAPVARTDEARYFSPEEGRSYFVDYGQDAYDGLGIRTPDRLYKLVLDSTPLSWKWSDVTVLPNNQAVAKVGPQIVLIDLETGEVAGLPVGDSPTVAIAK